MREHLLRLIYLYVPSSVLHIFLLFQLFPSLCEGFLGLLVEGFSVCYCLLKLRLLLFGHGHKQQTIISFILIIYAFYLFLLLYSVVNLSLDALEHWQNHIIIINCDFEIRVIAGIHGGCFGFLFIQELLDIFVYGI